MSKIRRKDSNAILETSLREIGKLPKISNAFVAISDVVA